MVLDTVLGRRVPYGLYTFVMVFPSTSVVVHSRSFVGDEDAMECHLSEPLTECGNAMYSAAGVCN